MAKIESISPPKNQKKRKLKEVHGSRGAEAESPTSKFKKLDISQIGVKKNKNSVAEASSSNAAMTKKKNKEPKPVEDIMVIEAPIQKEKSKKRKAESESTAKPNKSTKYNEIEQHDHDIANSPSYEPSVAELQLADKPENTPNIATTRQKKRNKHQKIVETAKIDSAARENERNFQYLNQWKIDRLTWKFIKLRQISIQKSLFREKDPIDDATWSLSLEYLSGTKGRGRDLLIEEAEKVIHEIDDRINSENQEELVNQFRYTRARELLQMFQ